MDEYPEMTLPNWRNCIRWILFIQLLFGGFLDKTVNCVTYAAGYNNDEPYFLQKISDVTAGIGRNATLTCAVANIGNHKVAWIDNQQKKVLTIDDQMATRNPRYRVSKPDNRTWSLHILDVHPDDEGRYTCQIDTRPSKSQIAFLRVLNGRGCSFEDKFNFLLAKSGDAIKLECTAVGDQPMHIMWQKEKVEIDPATSGNIEIREEPSDMLLTSELSIYRMTAENDGTYTCVCENYYGSDERTIKVIVLDAPSQPINVGLTQTGSRNVTVTWSPPEYDGRSSIRSYRIRYWIDEDEHMPYDFNQLEVPGTQTVAYIQELAPGQLYVLDVTAENEAGSGEPSAPVWFKTEELTPEAAPVYVTAKAQNSTSILVSWKPPTNESWNGDIKGYVVGYREIGTTQSFTRLVDFDRSSEVQEHLLTNLKNGTEYSITVAAYNAAGTGPPSLELRVFTTTADAPEIEPFSFPRFLRTGQRTNAKCAVRAGDGPFEFHFLKDGKEITMPNVRIIYRKRAAIIKLQSLEADNSGNYTCLVSNIAGTDSHTAELIVLSPPIWVKQPKNTSVLAGRTLVLDCEGKGYPEPDVTWKKLAQRTEYGRNVTDAVSVPSSNVMQNGSLIINRASNDTAGVYECTISNGIGTDLQKTVKVAVIPSNTSEPFFTEPISNVTVAAGSNAILNCAVENLGPYSSLAWFHLDREKPLMISYGLDIISEEKPNRYRVQKTGNVWSLHISNVREEDEGQYLCQVNFLQTVPIMNQIGYLDVVDPPEVKQFNFASNLQIGQEAIAKCEIQSGEGPFAFYFFKDNEVLKNSSNVTVIYNENSILIKIFPLSDTDAGNYTCSAYNKFGGTTYSAELLVNVPPSWKIQPKKVHLVASGDLLVLPCEGEGYPPPNVTWRRSEKLTQQGRLKPTFNYTNLGINGSLVIENIQKDAEGFYECIISNGVGKKLTSKVMVSVRDAPRLQSGFAFPQIRRVGEGVTVVCKVGAGDGPFAFRILKDGYDVRNTSRIFLMSDGTSAYLEINLLTMQDAGNYTCIASNIVGKDVRTAQLVVHMPPAWKTRPEDIKVGIGDDLVVDCVGAGYPEPRALWRKIVSGPRTLTTVGQDIRNQNQTEFHIFYVTSFNGSLIIENVQKEIEGVYECVITNGVGKDLKQLVKIWVKVPAKFDEKFSVVAVRRGESAKLKCEAQGDQPLSVTWMKDSIKLSKTGGDRFEIFETMTDTGIISEMVIRTTDRVDGAMYKCLAENEYGKDERATKLLIIEVPGSPLNLRMREVWSQSASVTWAAPYSGNSPITQYVIQYWRDSGAPHRLLEKHVPSAQTSTLIGDLSPGTRYALTILAENSVGRGEPARTVTFATGDEEPSAAPTDIVVEARGPSTVRVAWKPPPKDDWNGQLLGYYVGFKAKDSSQPFSHKTVPFANNATQEYFLKNLLKETEYCIVVKAFNSAGSGPSSHEMWVHTLDGDLPAAPVLFVVTTSTTAMTVRWSNKGPDVPITGYTLYYRKEHGPWQEVSLPASADNSYTLRNLDSVGTYQVYVTASNRYGMGDPSEIATVRTEGYVMESPTSAPVCCDLPFLIPVVTAAVAVVIVIVVTCLCVRRIKRRRDPGPALYVMRESESESSIHKDDFSDV